MASIRHALAQVKEDLPRHIESHVYGYLAEHGHIGARRGCRPSLPLARAPDLACRWDELFDARYIRSLSDFRTARPTHVKEPVMI